MLQRLCRMCPTVRCRPVHCGFELLASSFPFAGWRGSDVFGKDGLQTSDGVLKMGTLTSGVQETYGNRGSDGLKTYRPASLSPS